MSLLLLLRPHGQGAGVTPPPEDLPLPSTSNTARHKQIEPPRYERLLGATARIYLRATQPDLLLVPTAKGGTVRLSSKPPDWEMALESQAGKTPILYRATRDDRYFDELVRLAYLLTRDPL